MKQPNPYIVISAGGTGGHVYPAVSVAEYLVEQSHAVSWFGRSSGFEQSLLSNHKTVKYVPIYHVFYQGRHRYIKLMAKVLGLVLAWGRCLITMLLNRPRYVIVFGSYISFPVGLAALCLRIPLIIHEQNSVWGRANRMLAPFCKKALSGFETTKTFDNQLVTGNPLRLSWLNRVPEVSRPQSDPRMRILVLGGSQGAQTINQLMIDLIETYPLLTERFTIQWQTGSHLVDLTHEAVEIHSYIDRMYEAYSEADVLISRAGAMTVSEALFFSLPAVFIPYPYATDQHQYHNAIAAAKQNKQMTVMDKPTVTELYEHLSAMNAQRHNRLVGDNPLIQYNGSKTLAEFIL